MDTRLDTDRPAASEEDIVRQAALMGLVIAPDRVAAVSASVSSLTQRLARLAADLSPTEAPTADRRAV